MFIREYILRTRRMKVSSKEFTLVVLSYHSSKTTSFFSCAMLNISLSQARQYLKQMPERIREPFRQLRWPSGLNHLLDNLLYPALPHRV